MLRRFRENQSGCVAIHSHWVDCCYSCQSCCWMVADQVDQTAETMVVLVHPKEARERSHRTKTVAGPLVGSHTLRKEDTAHDEDQ